MEVNVKARPSLESLVGLLYGAVEGSVGADGLLVALGRLLHWPVWVQPGPKIWVHLKYLSMSLLTCGGG